MKTIHIQASTYGKGNYPRLAISDIDERGYGGGTRIVGAKFGDFESGKEIDVPLTLKQAKELLKELQRTIESIEAEPKEEPKPLFHIGESVSTNGGSGIIEVIWMDENGYRYGLKGLLGFVPEHAVRHAESPKPEPKPLFEVGETVNSNFTNESVKSEVVNRQCKDGEWIYVVISKTKETKMMYNNVPESSLRKLPKTKLVFSLEKWVEKRMKREGADGAKYIAEYYDKFKAYDGKTKEEISKKNDLLRILDEPDLFVEVEVK